MTWAGGTAEGKSNYSLFRKWGRGSKRKKIKIGDKTGEGGSRRERQRTPKDVLCLIKQGELFLGLETRQLGSETNADLYRLADAQIPHPLLTTPDSLTFEMESN